MARNSNSSIDEAYRRAFDLYVEHYDAKRPCADQVNVSAAASVLCSWLERFGEETGMDDGEGVWRALMAIEVFAKQYPQGLDYALHVFLSATKMLPDDFESDYGKGNDIGMSSIRFYIADYATMTYSGQFHHHGRKDNERVGERDLSDHSNELFTLHEFINEWHEVFRNLDDKARDRFELVLSNALHARANCAGVSGLKDLDEYNTRWHPCYQAVVNIERALGTGSWTADGKTRWSKADFIANCILLRGCAAYLVQDLPEEGCVYYKRDESSRESRSVKLRRWKERFACFIVNDQNDDFDFQVKHHAYMVLQNLHEGPRDETSDELFAPHSWIQ